MVELSRVPEGKEALMHSRQVSPQGTEHAGEGWRMYLALGGK